MPFTLEVIQNTLFKRRPEQSLDLRPEELFAVTKGTRLEIQSYAYADGDGGFDAHIQFAIANPEDWINGLNTWYVYDSHARVLEGNRIVYPLPRPAEPGARFRLRVTRDTVLKRRPVQAADLPAEELYRISQGTTLDLQSYAYATAQGDFNGHIRFALRSGELNGFNTWYIYEGHAQVLADGKTVYPYIEEERPQRLNVTTSTVFKTRPVPSDELAPNERVNVRAGAQYEIRSYAYADAQGGFNNHIKFTLARPEDYIQGRNTWFVFQDYAQVIYDGVVVYPLPVQSPPRPAPGSNLGPSIRLPGFTSTFYVNQPIIPGGSFTWGEATKDGSRIPTSRGVVENILALARRLEEPRRQLGRPFRVSSWYRDPETNRRVGGARFSEHLYGGAADFSVDGIPARQVASRLAWWPGGLGSYPTFVHLDIGPRRRWTR
ncbi:MAG TPA: D-Ala-D-Ala carboxypeptidase family metallohydrolase [Trichocoleus sp.]